MKGPSKFMWSGLLFTRGPHPRGLPKNCWFNDPLKLAVVETRPGNFTAYARLADVYEQDENGDASATVFSAEHSHLDKYSPDHHAALDALLRQLQLEVTGPYALKAAATRAAELIDEIEDAYRRDDHYP